MIKTTTLIAVAGLATLGTTAGAQLIGASFRAPDFQGPSTLYGIDTGTGLASGGIATNVRALTGLTYHNGTLWGLTDQFGQVNGQGVDTALLTFDRLTGQATVIGNIGEVGGFLPSEGDLDFDPATGRLYSVTSNNGASILFEIDIATATGSVVGTVAGGDLSAMSFDAQGNLWALDTSFDFTPGRPAAQLLRLDVATGAVLESISTGQVLGTVAGMDFDPATGLLYIADGDFGGTNNLYTFDFGAGSLSLVGPTGLDGAPTGFGGLSALTFVPSPGTGAMFLVGALAAGRRRR